MIGKNNAVTYSRKGQGFKIKLFEFLVYLEPVVFPKHHKLDCKTVGFFLKISKEIGNAWRKSLMRANRARRERKNRLSVFHTMAVFSRAVFQVAQRVTSGSPVKTVVFSTRLKLSE